MRQTMKKEALMKQYREKLLKAWIPRKLQYYMMQKNHSLGELELIRKINKYMSGS